MGFTWCTDGGDEVGLVEHVDAAFSAWFALAPCAGLDAVWVGTCTGADKPDLAVRWGDPSDVLEPGVLWATFTEIEDGHVVATELVFNDGEAFSTDAEVAAGECEAATNLDLALRHAIGRFLGLPEVTCSEADPCADTAEAEAVMFCELEPCSARMLNAVDATLLRDAYSPFASAYPGEEPLRVVGAPPLDVCLALAADASAPADAVILWDFGDGGAAGEGLEACHTYTDEGRFTVAVSVTYAACEGADTFDPYALVSAYRTPSDEDTGAPDREPMGCGCASAAGPVGAFGASAGLGLAALLAVGLARRHTEASGPTRRARGELPRKSTSRSP